MALTPTGDRLPCGAQLEALVAQVADGSPPADPAHQASCPYCQSALRSLRAGWADVRLAAAAPVTVPPGLTRRVMDRVAALRERVAQGFVVLGSDRGETQVPHAIVARVAQRLAAAVPGVAFASARPLAEDPPAPGRLRIVLRVALDYGPPVAAVAAAIRTSVLRRIRRLTGAEVTAIDIEVEDLVD